MKINIMCSDTGWIYEEFVHQLKKHSKHTILLNSKEKCDITHYLPYYETPNDPLHPCTAWFSHQEQRPALHRKFISAAKSVNVAISQSKKYADILKNENVGNVVQIMVGVDTEKFNLRSENRPTVNEKLIVIYSGRAYSSSDRKNPKLIKRISKLPFVDFRATNGKLKQEDLPKFFHEGDVCVQPSLIEGGSMAIQESLCCGLEIVSMRGVGVTDEFGIGVLKANNDDHFIKILKKMHKTKSHINYWRKKEIMQQLRSQVEQFTWKNFAEKHDKVWSQLIQGE